jgi:hypothetical protein
VRINIHRQASFNRVFTKCLIAAWGESREEASYILTDTGGMKIPEELVIDRADCTDHTLPWTLEAYLQVTKMTYHSRPKFQVLKRPLTSQVDSFPPTQQQVMSDPSADADAGPSSLQQADLVERSQELMDTEYQSGTIRPLFLSVVYSRYDEDKVIWKGPLRQEDALGFNLDYHDPDDSSLMENVQSQLMNKPGEEVISEENPCHHGMIFCGYEKNGIVTDFVADVKRNEIVYSQREADAMFETLCSYQVSMSGQTVGLMCVALNGFHCAKCTYSWSRDVDGKPIPDESYPVIYSTTAGKYVCTVAVEGYKDVRVFIITCEEGQLKVQIDCSVAATIDLDAEVQGNSATSTIDICGDGIGVTQPDKVLYKHSTKKSK